jgi:hypothetical protein
MLTLIRLWHVRWYWSQAHTLKNLYDEEADQCKKVIYLDRGVDFETFAVAEENPHIPADMGSMQTPIVRLHWFT